MDALLRLGWNESWLERFDPHARAGSVPVRICAEHKGLYHFLGAHIEGLAQVSGRLRHQATGRADFPAVGDWVALNTSPEDGGAVICAVLPRANKLSRKAPGRATEEQILAANLDTLFFVASLNQDLNARRLERFLAATSLPGCQPVLLLTKRDLCAGADAIVEDFQTVMPAVPVHAVSALTGDGLDALGSYLQPGRTVAMLGSSGVGKSTLLNRLLGQERQAVQPIRQGDDRGRHTTTHRELTPLPQGGLLIDSPGLREFQLWDEGTDVTGAFTDIGDLAGRCFFADCSHQHEPRCAVRQAVADGLLEEGRLENFVKLTKELTYLETRLDPEAGRARKERDRRIHRAMNKEKRKGQGRERS
jgi:ribosome biogenesis GTPase